MEDANGTMEEAWLAQRRLAPSVGTMPAQPPCGTAFARVLVAGGTCQWPGGMRLSHWQLLALLEQMLNPP